MSESCPKWKYHRTLPATLCLTREDERALGVDWADSPLAFGLITCPAEGQDAYDPALDLASVLPVPVAEPPARRPGRPRRPA